MVLDSFFNALFGWAIRISPLFGIIVISFALTLITTLAYKFFTDQHAIKDLRDSMKNLQQRMKESADDKHKIELSKEMWSKNMEAMKHNFKPMLITFIPIIIIFGWLRKTYECPQLLEGITNLCTPFGPIFLNYFQWLGTYFIFSILFSILLRKLFNVH